jgi:hypothetical protein
MLAWQAENTLELDLLTVAELMATRNHEIVTASSWASTHFVLTREFLWFQ